MNSSKKLWPLIILEVSHKKAEFCPLSIGGGAVGGVKLTLLGLIKTMSPLKIMAKQSGINFNNIQQASAASLHIS